MIAPPSTDPPALRRFMALLLMVSIALVGMAWLWQGFDFAAAALVGCLLMVLSFFWTRMVVRKAFLDENPRLWLGLSYGMRIGLAIVVLYIAIREFGMDPFGIAMGVSTLVLTAVVYAIVASVLSDDPET